MQWISNLAGEQRAPSFIKALEIAHSKDFRHIVETGSYHGNDTQGKSTLIFAFYCKEHPTCMLESVDISKDSTTYARDMLNRRGLPGECINQDSIEFLKTIQHQIDLLYLDSYDFEPDKPEPSQKHQLREVEAAYPNLGTDSIVLLDDCGIEHGGKGYWSTIYLIKRGWKIIHEGYQTLLSR